jgi:hypothetical protein
MKVCTVIGFPNGYSTTAVKVFEAEDALRNGADEIDMVIDLGDVEGRRVRQGGGGDPCVEGRLRRACAQGHRGDLPSDRGGED